MENKKITRMNIGDHLFNHQLSIVGKTMADVIDDDKWWTHWTLTTDEYHGFKKYAIKLIEKTFKCRKKKAIDIFLWFYTTFGLRIQNNKPITSINNNNDEL